MSEEIPRFDPNIFQEGMELEFSLVLTAAAEKFSVATGRIEEYQKGAAEPDDTTIGDVLGPRLSGFVSGGGEGFSTQFGEVTVTPIGDTGERTGESITMSLSEFTQADYQRAIKERDSSSADLVFLVTGRQQYILEQLVGIYSSEEATQKAWRLMWTGVRDLVRAMEGGYLADVADFFDELVKLQYPATFDPMDRWRGKDAKEDIAAKTFYEVMETHLKRANYRRDSWS